MEEEGSALQTTTQPCKEWRTLQASTPNPLDAGGPRRAFNPTDGLTGKLFENHPTGIVHQQTRQDIPGHT